MGQRTPETEIGGERGSFPSTLWSVVLRAQDPESPERRKALETLITAYWKPLYFFVRRKGNDPEASKELTQGFFTELLAKDYLKTVAPGQGRFRAFLLVAIKHYLADQLDRERAQKRGGGLRILSLDFPGAERDAAEIRAGSESLDQTYAREWAVQVMGQAFDALRNSYEARGRAAEFEHFKRHLTSLHPQGVTYEALSSELGLSVEDVRNRIRAARTQYRDAILEVIRSYTNSPDEAREELHDLLTAFS